MIKPLLLTVFYTACMMGSYAQTSDEEAVAVINLLGVQKKEAVARLVPVEAKDSAAFWKIYDEYQKKTAPVAKNRLQLYETTANSYGAMSDGMADSLAKKYFENRMTQEKSLEEYYKKIKTATNATTAFEFYQAEVYLLTYMRAQIMQRIPTYGEFKAQLKKKE